MGSSRFRDDATVVGALVADGLEAVDLFVFEFAVGSVNVRDEKVLKALVCLHFKTGIVRGSFAVTIGYIKEQEAMLEPENKHLHLDLNVMLFAH